PAGAAPVLPKAKPVIDWPSQTPTMRPPPPPWVARPPSLPATDAATPPVSERPVRDEPKVVIAVAGIALPAGGTVEPVPASLDELDVVEDSDPPSSGAVPTPRIPLAPQAPS